MIKVLPYLEHADRLGFENVQPDELPNRTSIVADFPDTITRAQDEPFVMIAIDIPYKRKTNRDVEVHLDFDLRYPEREQGPLRLSLQMNGAQFLDLTKEKLDRCIGVTRQRRELVRTLEKEMAHWKREHKDALTTLTDKWAKLLGT